MSAKTGRIEWLETECADGLKEGTGYEALKVEVAILQKVQEVFVANVWKPERVAAMAREHISKLEVEGVELGEEERTSDARCFVL